MKGRGAGAVVGMNHEKNGDGELLQVTDFMVSAFKEVDLIFFLVREGALS